MEDDWVFPVPALLRDCLDRPHRQKKKKVYIYLRNDVFTVWVQVVASMECGKKKRLDPAYVAQPMGSQDFLKRVRGVAHVKNTTY